MGKRNLSDICAAVRGSLHGSPALLAACLAAIANADDVGTDPSSLYVPDDLSAEHAVRRIMARQIIFAVDDPLSAQTIATRIERYAQHFCGNTGLRVLTRWLIADVERWAGCRFLSTCPHCGRPMSDAGRPAERSDG